MHVKFPGTFFIVFGHDIENILLWLSLCSCLPPDWPEGQGPEKCSCFRHNFSLRQKWQDQPTILHEGGKDKEEVGEKIVLTCRVLRCFDSNLFSTYRSTVEVFPTHPTGRQWIPKLNQCVFGFELPSPNRTTLKLCPAILLSISYLFTFTVLYCAAFFTWWERLESNNYSFILASNSVYCQCQCPSWQLLLKDPARYLCGQELGEKVFFDPFPLQINYTFFVCLTTLVQNCHCLMHAWYFPSGIPHWGAKRCPNQTRRHNSGNALEPFFFRFVRNQDFPLIYMYVYKYICFRWHHSLLILPPTLFIRHTFIQWASDLFFWFVKLFEQTFCSLKDLQTPNLAWQ